MKTNIKIQTKIFQSIGGIYFMGLFSKKTKEQKEAIKELKTYKKNKSLRYRQILPLYSVMKMENDDVKYYKFIINTITKEIENNETQTADVERRVHELLTEKYGEPMTQEQADEEFNKFMQQTEVEKENLEKEKKLENKFGVTFTGRTWFKCTVEEHRRSTFSNTDNRDVVHGYVFVEDNYLEIIKESVFIKSKMGTVKIYYDNIASIDYDARGRLNLSSNLMINLKSHDVVQLKFLNQNMVELVMGKFEEYMDNKVNNVDSSGSGGSSVDDLMKLAELYEKGLLTKEEFESQKQELLK